jgi:rRNA maturation RNase YbeY
MLNVTVLDTSSKAYKARALKVASWLMQESKKGDFSLEIFIVGNDLMPKNVLAFPADTSFPRPDLSHPSLGEIHLNPIYISEHDENFEYMLVHGFLHLLGYDHMKKNDRIVMEKEERRLLNTFKQANS